MDFPFGSLILKGTFLPEQTRNTQNVCSASCFCLEGGLLGCVEYVFLGGAVNWVLVEGSPFNLRTANPNRQVGVSRNEGPLQVSCWFAFKAIHKGFPHFPPNQTRNHQTTNQTTSNQANWSGLPCFNQTTNHLKPHQSN